MNRIKQYFKAQREGRAMMRELRRAWQMNSERVAQMPFFTDEELKDLYERACALPPLPQESLPPLPRQYNKVWRTALNTVPSAAVAALILLLVLPTPSIYAMTPQANSAEHIDAVACMIKEGSI